MTFAKRFVLILTTTVRSLALAQAVPTIGATGGGQSMVPYRGTSVSYGHSMSAYEYSEPTRVWTHRLGLMPEWRLAYERVKDTDGEGIGNATNDGMVVASYPITSHFDIRRQYNPSTGGQLNVIEENTQDRPGADTGGGAPTAQCSPIELTIRNSAVPDNDYEPAEPRRRHRARLDHPARRGGQGRGEVRRNPLCGQRAGRRGHRPAGL